jgi:putative Holliday junction resolvase
LSHTILAFDFGEKRIGVAVGNTFLRQAQPLKTILNKSADYTFEQIGQLMKKWDAKLFVVGLPRHPDGNPHEMTKKATRFGNQLNGRLNIPVVWVDERYTSAVAGDLSGDIDAQAAVMILEQYFVENPT